MGTGCICFILHHQTVVVPLSGIMAVFCFVTTIPGISPERIVQQADHRKVKADYAADSYCTREVGPGYRNTILRNR